MKSCFNTYTIIFLSSIAYEGVLNRVHSNSQLVQHLILERISSLYLGNYQQGLLN